MKRDIENREDVVLLVDSFYQKVLESPLIAIFFKEVVPISLVHHMPIMYDFWESLIFDLAKYRGNPMTKHMVMDEIKSLEEVHFQEWLGLWTQTVDELYLGEYAEKAKDKGQSIASLMQYKITNKKQLL